MSRPAALSLYVLGLAAGARYGQSELIASQRSLTSMAARRPPLKNRSDSFIDLASTYASREAVARILWGVTVDDIHHN